MSLEGRPLKFSSITNHASVTQCLGSIGGHVWHLGVAKSSRVDSSEDKGNKGSKVVQAHSGHSYVPPAIEDVRVFRFSGPKFVKLNPRFVQYAPHQGDLDGTLAYKVVDHTTHCFFKKDDKVMFTFDE